MNAFNRIAEVLNHTEETDVPLELTSESLDNVENFVKESNLSPLELYIVFDRAEKLAKEIRNAVKDEAGEQYQLLFEESKNNVLGNDVTLSVVPKYEYKNTPQIKRYKKQIESLEKTIEPTLKEIKGYKDSIKSSQEAQKTDGTAKQTGQSYRISISKS